jgi:hypothetical protein
MNFHHQGRGKCLRDSSEHVARSRQW